MTDYQLNEILNDLNDALVVNLEEEDFTGYVHPLYTPEDYMLYNERIVNDRHLFQYTVCDLNSTRYSKDVEAMTKIDSITDIYADFWGEHLDDYPHRVIAQCLCINKDEGSMIKAIHAMGIFYIRKALNDKGKAKLENIIKNILIDPELINRRFEQYFVFNGSIGFILKRTTQQKIKTKF